MLTQKELKKEIIYYRSTGKFKWRRYKNGRRMNKYIGSYSRNGYIQIRIDYKCYYAHRLAWLYVYGEFPKEDIDHINRIKDDNRICNLRDVNRSINIKNTNLRKDNKSGCKGVSWCKERNKWLVNMKINGENKFLGRFDNKDEAINIKKINKLKYKESK